MAQTLKAMLEAAHSVVPRISAEDAQIKIKDGALLLDVRDAPELAASGKAKGAHNVSRGTLEFRAEPDSPNADPEFRTDRAIILFCAAGGCAALAGQALKELGYKEVYNLGGLKDWADGGGEVS